MGTEPSPPPARCAHEHGLVRLCLTRCPEEVQRATVGRFFCFSGGAGRGGGPSMQGCVRHGQEPACLPGPPLLRLLPFLLPWRDARPCPVTESQGARTPKGRAW